jgi:hypothetical protein
VGLIFLLSPTFIPHNKDERENKEGEEKEKNNPCAGYTSDIERYNQPLAGIVMGCTCDVVGARGPPSSAKRVYEGKCGVLLYSFF